MKNKLIIALFISIAWLMPSFAKAESITTYNSQIHINQDATLAVTELVRYDFGDVAHHGIFRDIPYHYSARGGNFNLRIAVTSVTDTRGDKYPYSVTTSGGMVHVKIGDANATVTGVHEYVLKYTVQRAINYFTDHDELYWNVTGNSWQVSMENISAQAFLPSGVDPKSLELTCFSGPTGSVTKCGGASVALGTGGKSTELDFSQSVLDPAEGLTVVVSFPKGLVAKPTVWQNLMDVVKDNGILLLPLVVFIGMYLLWRKKGRDPQGYSTIVPQYEAPKDLTPTEAGTIVDERADNQDVSAEIINLAVNGYLKITRLEKKILFFDKTDYQLDMLKDSKDLPNAFQRKLMDSLFLDGMPKVVLSELKNKFYTDLRDIKDEVYSSVVVKGYFAKNPELVRNIYSGVGIAFLFLGFFFAAKVTAYSALAVVLSGIIILIFSRFMSVRTVKGAEARQYILGLKMYLSIAEKDRLKFFNAPEKSPERFEKLLPYAMVLGVEKEWANEFKDIYKTPPSWYNDSTGHAFSTGYLIGSLNSFSATANTNFSSTPSSSASGGGSGFSGGSSGGGFGGGGGGSW